MFGLLAIHTYQVTNALPYGKLHPVGGHVSNLANLLYNILVLNDGRAIDAMAQKTA